jgi:hypothetical protein
MTDPSTPSSAPSVIAAADDYPPNVLVTAIVLFRLISGQYSG